MIIVAGALHVDPIDRDAYVAACREVVELARKADGCIDFSLSADLIDLGRVNIFEQWESLEAVIAFRGGGPSSEQVAAIQEARVFEYEISSSKRL